LRDNLPWIKGKESFIAEGKEQECIGFPDDWEKGPITGL